MLYVVATPIGNLGDISMRAKEVLIASKYIACEDTRHSKILLESIGAKGRAISFHAHSGQLKFEQILDLLVAGEDVALISDAGTPAISDPGGKLIELAHQNDIIISPIPGPSSVITALSVAGFEADQFIYYGYLPKKKGKQTMLKEISEQKMTSVIFESPHRIERTFQDLATLLAPERRICICRELTKKFEEIICDSISNIEFDKIKPLGEFVIVIEGIK